MKRYFILCFFISLVTQNISLAQPSNALFAYENYRKANDILEKSIASHGVLDENRAFQTNMIGKFFSQDHLTHPDSIKLYTININSVSHLENARIKISYQRNKRTWDYEEILLDKRYFDIKKGKAFEVNPLDVNDKIAENAKYLPQHILLEAKDNLSSLSYLGKEGGYEVISYVDVSAQKWLMHIDSKTFMLDKLSSLYYDNGMGDSYDIRIYQNYIDWNGMRLPQNYNHYELGKLAWDLSFSYQYLDEKIAWTLPDSIELDSPVTSESNNIKKDSIQINIISKDIYEILLPQTNNRLLLAIFDEYAVLLEGSYHSRNGDLLLDYIKEKFPKKPVKYYSYSHLHTQYIAFVRSIAAIGATTILPKSNLSLVEKMVENNHTMNPDMQSKVSMPLKYQLANEKTTLKDQDHQIDIYDIGPIHTEQYLIYHFPKEKVLFIGDLLWVKGNKIEILTGRTYELYKAIEKLKIKPQTLLTSWPLSGYDVKNRVTYKEFQKAGKRADLAKKKEK